jgi:nickel/cobalt transporter (NicO) family protein
MPRIALIGTVKRSIFALLASFLVLFSFTPTANAHPLGNFTINHFARLQINPDQVAVQYVVDMAEIPAFQALQAADTDGNKTTSDLELQAYSAQITPPYVEGLTLQIDRQSVPLRLTTQAVSLPPGAGGLSTLRLEWQLVGAVPPADPLAVHDLEFTNQNDRNRMGWRELVVDAHSVASVFNSSAFSNSLTDALRTYPQDLLTTPLKESSVTLSFTQGTVPATAMPLRPRPHSATDLPHPTFLQMLFANATYQRLPLLPDLNWHSPQTMLMAIMVAALWGGCHSLSPGHGKTVVGAYLVGTRATPHHAFWLALTTTVTHTIGVFALGLVTLFASNWILPEQIYPWLSLGSGVMVVAIGVNLLRQRFHLTPRPAPLKGSQPVDIEPFHIESSPHHQTSHHHPVKPAVTSELRSLSYAYATSVTQISLELTPDDDHREIFHHHSNHDLHHHSNDHSHPHTHSHPHSHAHDHSHPHAHLPPDAEGDAVTWRSLLALGISGGLMPCPAALVLLLSAIALGQVGMGLILVVAFSVGLAGVLTGLGLLLVYAKQRFQTVPMDLPWLHRLPALSALGITIVGLGISTKALWDMNGGGL